MIDRFHATAPGEIAISTVTVAEMMYGVEKSQQVEKNHTALELFLVPLKMVEFDYNAARQYGSLQVDLEKKKTSIGAYDLMIAAHALSLGIEKVRETIIMPIPLYVSF